MVSIGAALHLRRHRPAGSNSKPWPSPRGFGTTNSDRPRWALRAVGVGAGQQHQHVGPRAERAPRLHAVDQPAVAVAAVAVDLDAGDVGAEVGLGHRDRGHHLGRWPASAATPASAPRCRPASSARARISGRVMSEPPAPSEPRDSSSVATTMPRYSDSPPAREPAVLLGDRQAEAAHLGQARDDVLGDVGVLCGGCARRPAAACPRRSAGTCPAPSRSRASRWRGPSLAGERGEEPGAR